MFPSRISQLLDCGASNTKGRLHGVSFPLQSGFVRCATCTPASEVADPECNAQAVIELAREGHDQHVALMVFPELCVSGYAIDDLLGQDALLDAVEASIAMIVSASEELTPVLLIGAPLRHEGRLFNCALAIHSGKILGVVPKTHLPNYREFYEKRWFASGRSVRDAQISVGGHIAPFGVDLLFAAREVPDFVFHVEICEDLWAPAPPSDFGALAGALILANLSGGRLPIAPLPCALAPTEPIDMATSLCEGRIGSSQSPGQSSFSKGRHAPRRGPSG